MFLPAFQEGFRLNKTSVNGKIDDRKKMQENIAAADVVVFHRPEEPEYLPLAKILKQEGKIVVMDNDDTFKIEDHYPLAGLDPHGVSIVLENRDKAITEFMKIADVVTASTEFLAKEYREASDNVVVLPNCIDPLDWPKTKRNGNNKVRIGMVGSVAYEYDYLHMKDILIRLSEREDVQLVLFGLGDKKHREENPNVTKAFSHEYKFWDSIDIEQVPWCPIETYPETLNNTELDMMLIPRKDNYFNRCKSNVKFLEAAMCEIPVIAQSFTDAPYEELTPDMGFLVKDNDKWEQAIEILIKDKDLRRSMGKKSKEYVLKNFNIESRSHEWFGTYKKAYEKRN